MQAWRDAYIMRQRAGEITITPDRRPPAPEPNQRIRKRIEEAFGWIKTVAGLRQTKLRGRPKVDWAFTSPRRPTTWCERPS
jgi:hypothetical protein